MLVGFPVAFYTATFVGYIVYAATADVFWYRFAAICNWVGVIGALLAAIPGLADWALGSPKGTRAKARGLLRAGLNGAALVAFGISAILAIGRWDEPQPGAAWHIVLGAIGLCLTLPAGFLGWELVQTHHVGVELSPEQERLEEPMRAQQPMRPPAERPTVHH